MIIIWRTYRKSIVAPFAGHAIHEVLNSINYGTFFWVVYKIGCWS